MGFLRFLFALAALPFAVALTRTFVQSFHRAITASGDAFYTALVMVLIGFAFFLALWALCPKRPIRLYVLAHELTHAAVALLFGARVSHLKVAVEGGSVETTKSNILITLGPYFIPFYTCCLVLAAGCVRLACGHLPYPSLWLLALGFTWAFHFCFTLQTLMHEQPDVLEYGRLFSWTFIWCAHLILLIFALWWVTPLSFAPISHTLIETTATAYRTVGAFLVWVWTKLPK